MSRVTVSMADVILSCRCWIFLIFSAYTMFLMYPHRKKSSGERSGLRGGQGIGPPLPIQASENLSFKTSVTKQLKCGGALSCIKITILTISFSKVSICGNTYFVSYSGFKSRPSFSMNLYVQKIKRWEPMSKRPIGRPKTRWEDDILEDKKSINIRNWKKVAQSRDSWKKVVEQARNLYRL